MSGTLRGTTVLVTRPEAESDELSGLLRRAGAAVLSAPAIRLSPGSGRELSRAVGDLAAGGFAWAVFTSRAGAEAVLGRLANGGRRVRVPARVAAVGEGTAEAVRAFGVRPDLIPRSFTTASLARAFPRGAGRVLLARADIAPDALDRAVAAKGWTAVRVDAYRTRPVGSLPASAIRALRAGSVDVATFTSASTVQGFVASARRGLGPRAALPPAVCIGPVTSRAAREAGLRVAAVARPHTIEGLVAAVERAVRPRRPKEL